jgi:hypothetical protein
VRRVAERYWVGAAIFFIVRLLNRLPVPQSQTKGVIVFSTVPVAGRGGPDALDSIQGRVLRAQPDHRIVLYAHSGGLWLLQPTISHPFTDIKAELKSNLEESWRLHFDYAARN